MDLQHVRLLLGGVYLGLSSLKLPREGAILEARLSLCVLPFVPAHIGYLSGHAFGD